MVKILNNRAKRESKQKRREERKRKKIHWSPSPISPTPCPHEKGGEKAHPSIPPRSTPVRGTTSSSLLIHTARNFSARRHGIRQCSHGRMQFKCRFRAGSPRIERGAERRSGAEVVANCDPRTRPAGNGEELSRMDGRARLLAS